MEIRVVKDEDITQFEELRMDVFSLYDNGLKYYLGEYLEGDLMILGAYINNELVGALYLSPFQSNSCYVQQLFVKFEYQNSKYHIGTALLKYVEEHIEEISNYFCMYLKRLYIEYIDEISHKVYLNAGYQD
nr:GNAT family N-acetyltransferase [Bacilli bacterium]